MRKAIKRVMAVLLASVLMCGCGNNTEPAIDGGGVEGKDWRTWGIIDATGTLKSDSSELSVCACVFADRTELYYDKESQELFKTIEYPEKMSTEEYEHSSLFFEDLNGDGFTDITVSTNVDGAEKRFSYVYDQGEYVYMEALSYPPKNYDAVDFSGKYTEPVTGRSLIEITKVSDGHFKVDVQWANGAAESVFWEIGDAVLSAAGTELEYSNARNFTRTYTTETEYKDEEHYTDGTGKFWIGDDGMLNWLSDKSNVDNVDGSTTFEKLP